VFVDVAHRARPVDANGFVAILFLALAGFSISIVTRCSSSNGVTNGFVSDDFRACVAVRNRVTGVIDASRSRSRSLCCFTLLGDLLRDLSAKVGVAGVAVPEAKGFPDAESSEKAEERRDVDTLGGGLLVLLDLGGGGNPDLAAQVKIGG
jgi:hypothetical protein